MPVIEAAVVVRAPPPTPLDRVILVAGAAPPLAILLPPQAKSPGESPSPPRAPPTPHVPIPKEALEASGAVGLRSGQGTEVPRARPLPMRDTVNIIRPASRLVPPPDGLHLRARRR